MGAIGFNPAANANLTFWLDPQTRTSWSMSGSEIVTAVSEVGSATMDSPTGQRPTIVSVNSLDMMSFDGVNEGFDGNASPGSLQPGSDDFTLVQVFRSTNAGAGVIWWKDDGAGKRWLLRINTGGSDLLFSIDDNTTAQTLTATDVDFANDDIYVVIASRDGTNLRLYYGNGGALVESGDSPVAIGSYGDLGLTDTQIGFEKTISPAQPFNGEMGDMLFYKEAISAGERGNLYSYLVSKWDL